MLSTHYNRLCNNYSWSSATASTKCTYNALQMRSKYLSSLQDVVCTYLEGLRPLAWGRSQRAAGHALTITMARTQYCSRSQHFIASIPTRMTNNDVGASQLGKLWRMAQWVPCKVAPREFAAGFRNATLRAFVRLLRFPCRPGFFFFFTRCNWSWLL